MNHWPLRSRKSWQDRYANQSSVPSMNVQLGLRAVHWRGPMYKEPSSSTPNLSYAFLRHNLSRPSSWARSHDCFSRSLPFFQLPRHRSSTLLKRLSLHWRGSRIHQQSKSVFCRIGLSFFNPSTMAYQGGLWGQQLYVPQSVCEIDRAFNPGSHPSREQHQRARTSLSKQPGIPAIEGGKQYMNSINFDTNTTKNTTRTLVVLGLHDSATAVSWQ